MTNKDLITQYVDTGLRIPEYQFAQLSNNHKKTYIRKRLISMDRGRNYDTERLLLPFELKVLPPEVLKEYLSNRIETTFHIREFEEPFLDDELKLKWAIRGAEKGEKLRDDLFNILPHDKKVKLANLKADKMHHISDEMFKLLDDKKKELFIAGRANNGTPLSMYMLDYAKNIPSGGKAINLYFRNVVKKTLKNRSLFAPNHGDNRDKYPQWFEELTPNLKARVIEMMIDYTLENESMEDITNIYIDRDIYRLMDPTSRKTYVKGKLYGSLKNGYKPHLSKDMFNDLNDEDKMLYAKQYADEDEYYTPSYLKPYIEKLK